MKHNAVKLLVLALLAAPLIGCQSLIGAAAGTAANAALAQVSPIPAADVEDVLEAQAAVQATIDSALAVIENFFIATGAPYPGFNALDPSAPMFEEVVYYVPPTGGIALRPVLEKFEDIQWQMTEVNYHEDGSRSFKFRRMIIPETETRSFRLSDLMANPANASSN